MLPFTVYAARKIITMNRSRPTATHVAVRDGRILGVGALPDLAGWGPHQLDQRFADQVLMPGLVEGHSHLMAGTFWRYTYCGFFDVTDPDGVRVAGSPSLDDVIAALCQAAAHRPEGPVVGWGFDPIYFGSRRCTRADLDRVSNTRPVGVLHASGHILNVNTAALQAAGFMRSGIEQDLQALALRLTTTSAGVLRAKGLLTDANGQRHLLQVVGTQSRISPAPTGATGPDRLAVIGLRDAYDGTPWT